MYNLSKEEFFSCDCGARDHLIVAKYSIIDWENKELDNDAEVSLEFVASKGDWESYSIMDNIVYRFFKRIKWRLKESIKILFTGKYFVEDTWLPLRTEDDNFFRIVGISECRKLGQFLIDAADKTSKFYSRSFNIAKTSASKGNANVRDRSEIKPEDRNSENAAENTKV